MYIGIFTLVAINKLLAEFWLDSNFHIFLIELRSRIQILSYYIYACFIYSTTSCVLGVVVSLGLFVDIGNISIPPINSIELK